jgi:hypothetical protein
MEYLREKLLLFEYYSFCNTSQISCNFRFYRTIGGRLAERLTEEDEIVDA